MHVRMVLAIWMFVLACCSSAEWVHPTKPKDEFAHDYNKCQGDILRDPKYQQGNSYMVLQGTERCVMKRGWVLRDKSE